MRYIIILFLVIMILPSPILAQEDYIKYVAPKLTELHRAVFYGKNDVVEFYAQAGTDLNALAGNNNTPLHMAAFRGKIESIRILLKYGADKTILNADNQTALDIARDGGFKNIVELLSTN